MIKRILKLACGILLSSFAITMVIHSQLGNFPITSANIALSNWLNISIGTSGMILELIMLVLAFKLGKGVSFVGLINATVGSLLIDVWDIILPYHKLLVLGILLLPISWYFSSSIGWGNTNQNLLMDGIIEKTNKSMGLIRGIQESLFTIIGLLGHGGVTPLTIILSLFFGKIMEIEYKLLKYDSTKVEHMYLIKGKGREKVVECSSFKDEEK